MVAGGSAGVDAETSPPPTKDPWRGAAPRIALAGALLAGVGYGLLAVANLLISNLLRGGALGDLTNAYLVGASGDVLVGVGLFLAIAGLALLMRR